MRGQLVQDTKEEIFREEVLQNTRSTSAVQAWANLGTFGRSLTTTTAKLFYFWKAPEHI